MRSSKKDFSGFSFIENTKENRATLAHGDKIAAKAYNGTYELTHDAEKDVFRSRLGVRGYYSPETFHSFALIRKAADATPRNWAKEWARVANSMRTHGINQAISDLIAKMLLIGEEEMQRLALIRSPYDVSELYPAGLTYEQQKEREIQLTDEWEAKHVAILADTKAWEILSLHTQNHTAIRLPKVIAIPLDASTIVSEIEAVRGGKRERGYVQHNGAQRDFTFSVWKSKDGRDLKASYASEYAGCGNGAYYIPFSPRYAFYAEHD